jgi:hypothetical protein
MDACSANCFALTSPSRSMTSKQLIPILKESKRG